MVRKLRDALPTRRNAGLAVFGIIRRLGRRARCWLRDRFGIPLSHGGRR